MSNIEVEDIKILEERIDYFKCNPEGCNWRLSFEDERDIQALESLLKAYKQDEEVIDEMASYILKNTCVLQWDGYESKVIEYFRKKVKE